MTLPDEKFDEKSLLPQHNPLPADRDQAWEEFQRGPGQRLLGYISRLLDDSHLDPDFYAEEIFDDTILAAQREIERGHYEDRGFKVSSWIYQIAKNKCNDAIRRSLQRPIIISLDDRPDLATSESVEQQVLDSLLRQQLYAAIAALPTDYREALQLHLEGHPNAEIAQKLDETCANIRQRLHRAKEKLVETLNPSIGS